MNKFMCFGEDFLSLIAQVSLYTGPFPVQGWEIWP